MEPVVSKSLQKSRAVMTNAPLPFIRFLASVCRLGTIITRVKDRYNTSQSCPNSVMSSRSAA